MTASIRINSHTDFNKIDGTRGNYAVEGGDSSVNGKNMDRKSHTHHNCACKTKEFTLEMPTNLLLPRTSGPPWMRFSIASSEQQLLIKDWISASYHNLPDLRQAHGSCSRSSNRTLPRWNLFFSAKNTRKSKCTSGNYEKIIKNVNRNMPVLSLECITVLSV